MRKEDPSCSKLRVSICSKMHPGVLLGLVMINTIFIIFPGSVDKYRAHTEPLIKPVKLLNIERSCDFKSSKFVYKFKNFLSAFLLPHISLRPKICSSRACPQIFLSYQCRPNQEKMIKNFVFNFSGKIHVAKDWLITLVSGLIMPANVCNFVEIPSWPFLSLKHLYMFYNVFFLSNKRNANYVRMRILIYAS